jgi:hypothetical protein
MIVSGSSRLISLTCQKESAVEVYEQLRRLKEKLGLGGNWGEQGVCVLSLRSQTVPSENITRSTAAPYNRGGGVSKLHGPHKALTFPFR